MLKRSWGMRCMLSEKRNYLPSEWELHFCCIMHILSDNSSTVCARKGGNCWQLILIFRRPPSAIHAPSVLRKEKQNNKFLFAVFQKQFLRFFARLLVLPLWDFPSSISIFSVLIKLEHIFHGRDFGFARKNFIGNPFESDAVLVDAEQQEGLFASENCALLTSGKSSSKKLDFNLV